VFIFQQRGGRVTSSTAAQYGPVSTMTRGLSQWVQSSTSFCLRASSCASQTTFNDAAENAPNNRVDGKPSCQMDVKMPPDCAVRKAISVTTAIIIIFFFYMAFVHYQTREVVQVRGIILQHLHSRLGASLQQQSNEVRVTRIKAGSASECRPTAKARGSRYRCPPPL
jgi:hypothetical protein